LVKYLGEYDVVEQAIAVDRQILGALLAVRKGDFTARLPTDWEGINGKIADAFNEVVELNEMMAAELERMSQVVGKEGKIKQRVSLGRAHGAWAGMVQSTNSLVDDLVWPTSEMARVVGAVAKGDLSQTMSLEAEGRPLAGEFLRTAKTVNTMVDQLSAFTSEVTRVAREVGTEGKLGGQATVKGLSGTWKDLTNSVNLMANNLTAQVRNIAEVTIAVADGDLSRKITVDVRGEILQLKDAINTMVDQLRSFASEVTRVAREVGTEGKLGGQAMVPGVAGVWKDLTDNVNLMANNLTGQVRNIAEVTTAVARGDLSRKITVDVQGEILELKNTINIMVDQLRSFASEVTRVAREVGTEGKLGGQAAVPGVAGVWKDLTDNVNLMANNLTGQVRNIAEVTTAVARGDLSRKITADVRGEILQLKDAINTMVDQLNAFASEVTRVAREVGTEGKLGGQAFVPGVGGVWKDLTDNVNLMANNLTGQVRNIAEVTTAVAKGDLSRKITVDVKGEILQLKDTINTMVDQLNAFASEVTRVAREVGTEGKLGGQAEVPGVAGVWKDLTDNVNLMGSNLTGQVRNIAEVTTAVAKGDLSRKITVDVKGEILKLKNTINTMVDQLNAFASEVTRVAREVGTEGKLGGQAAVPGVAGVWKDLTDNVNLMADNLTDQVRNIAEVTTAVAKGDLSRKITVDVKGEILQLKDTINTMVDQLNAFASEVTRVAREVGTEGKLGGQAKVPGVAGTWKDLTENVNLMANNLTGQVRNIAEVTTAVAQGDLSRKITVDVKGEILALKDTINTMVDQLNAFASEVTRVAREVGTEGKLGGQAVVPGVGGTWKDLTENVNLMASNLTGQVRNIADVTTAVAKGDLSRKITVDVKGEIAELKDTINTMVDQLNAFAFEVTRVGREVGTEGKLGGQARVPGVAGIWKDLTDNVNLMASNLTDQVRGIAKVMNAVAEGDLRQKLTVQAKGEIAALAHTINGMIDTLATFADQVTTVAREVGVEGRLGGQAMVPGASGTWKELVDNVNRLAANLTTQVRAIAEVATAVTKGDLTRHIVVDARGEVADLKDNVNEMIRNLRETTQRNTEQDWLKTNLANFSRMLQGHRDLLTVARLLLSELSPLVLAQYGAFYLMDTSPGSGNGKAAGSRLKLLATYGYQERHDLPTEWRLGEGLVGQCALEKRRIFLTSVPPDYIQITSGLGAARPKNIMILPVIFEGAVKAVVELASFEQFSHIHQSFLEQLTESTGIVLNTIEVNMRTEELLKQSQTLAGELQGQQEELRQTNEQLAEKARLLAQQNEEVERKNREIEEARRALEDKAEQLALTSRYKSEFLANMSHELRTPLNSLLLLSQQMSTNPEGNLTEKQVEYARIIHGSGNDLLTLINEVLDLSKIESGAVAVEPADVHFDNLYADLERTFQPVAQAKGLEFRFSQAPNLPETIYTDQQRLQQVLKNLLSNAFKFTDQGHVTLDIRTVHQGWNREHRLLNQAEQVIAFSVSDTGIGIPPAKQRLIFEAFQQADTGTSRKYGGTGLGLAISREIADRLGGELVLASSDSGGSIFTFYLPAHYTGPLPAARQARSAEEQHTAWSARDNAGFSKTAVTSEREGAMLATDDRNQIVSGDRALMVVEDDQPFARILGDIAREKGFKVLLVANGEEALALAREFSPAAITLDIGLPDTDGWTMLDRLKLDPYTRHIPVYIISVEEDWVHGLRHGAFAYLTKPATRESLEEAFTRLAAFTQTRAKQLLVVEDDPLARHSIVEFIGGGDVQTTAVGSGSAALQALNTSRFDCMVLDLKLPDMSGFELLEQIQKDSRLRYLPVIVYTGADLTKHDENRLHKLAKAVVIKDVRSPERLLDETALFLHRGAGDLTDAQRHILEQFYTTDDLLVGKCALVVDDDVRNIFALTSLLERHQMKVFSAESGKEALAILESEPGIDIVLMDIMMPEMDGYDTMRAIRRNPAFYRLPIIAITAKAMKGDREKCLEAGATDYVAKPVNGEQLLALLRVRFYQGSLESNHPDRSGHSPDRVDLVS
jgi:HAMP domain-containing protein/CheY-like chemotaxis protein/signal transduction histidine kinase